jgi:hypothetical protein
MKKIIITICCVVIVLIPASSSAQIKNEINAGQLLPRASVLISPKNGTFTEGATFEVPVILNSKGNEINGINVIVGFDPHKLMVVKPSGGQSIVGIWVEAPSFDNTRGIVSYVGVVPNGIKTDSGLVGTITFKAKSIGNAVVSVRSNSKILLNDGVGTEVVTELGRAEYSIVPKTPEGVEVFSETHPFPSEWYSNNSPVFSWEKSPGVVGFSYVLDNKPNTIPENKIISEETLVGFENLSEGLWYFHIKAYKNGTWGNTGHFLVRIDNTPPAAFEPKVDYVLAAASLVERSLVSFFTTDNLSGVNRYEVGLIDKNGSITESPVFFQSDSPFQVPLNKDTNLRVIVRAIDNAGNIRDASIDILRPSTLNIFIKDYVGYIALVLLLIFMISFVAYHFISKHFFRKNKNDQLGQNVRPNQS